VPGVLVFSSVYRPPFDEGVKRVVRHLHLELARRIETTLVTLDRGPVEDAEAVPDGPWGFVRGLRRVCRTARPDAVLYVPDAYLDRHTAVRLGLVRLAVGQRRIGVLTLQPNVFDLPTRMMLRLWKPDVLFTQTETDAGVCARFGIGYKVLSPAVDAERFRPCADAAEKVALRRKYGLPEDGRLCLHVGHIRRTRNVEWLVRLRLPPDAHLVVVGSRTRALEQDAKEALINHGATIVDSFVPTIEDLYRLADAYLFPVQDPYAAIEMPLSVLEAMACNLPVVSTPFWGLVRCFEGVPGVYFAETAEAFGNAVRRALDGPAPETRQAVQHLSWERLAGEVLESLIR